jgi:CheY-like chemotaxis protein
MVLPENAVILLAEDRPDDVILIQRALVKARVYNPVLVVHDGEEALDYLHGRGKFADRQRYPFPNLMLLDLKMPKLDGFHVLEAIRANRDFRSVRVIVLTSSQEIKDVNHAYELGASSFLVKPLEFDNYEGLMRTLSAFWLQRNAMPDPGEGVPSAEEEGSKKLE